MYRSLNNLLDELSHLFTELGIDHANVAKGLCHIGQRSNVLTPPLLDELLNEKIIPRESIEVRLC